MKINRNYSEVHQETKSSLQFLEENDLIEWNSTHQKFISTKLGKATVASALSPEEGLIVFEELQKGRKNFVLDNELHLLFQVTPIFHTIEPNWNKFYSIYCQLDSEMRRVCELIGISEAFLVKASISAPFQNQDAVNKFIIQLFLNLLLSKNCSRHKRLYASLILFELVRETPFWKITEQYVFFTKKEN